jgi:hypothetical protein
MRMSAINPSATCKGMRCPAVAAGMPEWMPPFDAPPIGCDLGGVLNRRKRKCGARAADAEPWVFVVHPAGLQDRGPRRPPDDVAAAAAAAAAGGAMPGQTAGQCFSLTDCRAADSSQRSGQRGPGGNDSTVNGFRILHLRSPSRTMRQALPANESRAWTCSDHLRLRG